ncbi:MAG TPA: TolC family protein [bacterium]|nr:TolC family protein [bacterium]
MGESWMGKACKLARALLAVGLLAAAGLTGATARAQNADSLDELIRKYPLVKQEDRQLLRVSLADVLRLALAGNHAVQAATASLAASGQGLVAAQERLQPTLSSNIQYGHQVSGGLFFNAPSGGPSPFVSVSGLDSTTFTTSVSKQDLNGVTYSLNYQEVRNQGQVYSIANEGDTPTTTIPLNSPKDASTTTGQVTIPLAQNAGREFNSIPVRQAEVSEQLARIGILSQEVSVLTTAAQTYWNLVGQLELVGVAQQAVQLDQQLVGENQVKLQAGVLSPADVLASQTQLARDQLSLVQARLGVRTFEDQVRAALGMENYAYGFQPTDTPAVRDEKLNPQQQLEEVYRFNPTLANLRANLESNSYNLLSAQNSAKPQLNANLSYVFNGYSKEPFVGPQYYLQSQTQGYVAALTYSVPLFDKVGPANIENQVLQRQALDLQLKDTQTQLGIQLQTALRNLRSAQEQVTTARVAVQLAQVQLQNEIEKLRQGRSTSFLVAQLQQQLSQAQQQEIAARVQYELNDLQRIVLTGEIYPRYNLNSHAGPLPQPPPGP